MSASHHHKHTQSVSPQEGPIREKRLLTATFLNLVIAVAEVVGGLLSNSLSLLSDALHNLSDGFALLIAYIANRISKKPSNERKTFGYKRIEILAALFNGLVLIAVTIYLFYEAYLRLNHPEPVKGLLMFVVAVIGLIANLVAVIILRKDTGNNINVKAAYLHLLSDTLSSVAVIIGGGLIYFFNIYWIDPVITILIGIYILIESWSVLKQTIDILMQATPSGLDLENIRDEIERIPEIANVHHVHAWNLDDTHIHYECHVDLKEDIHLSGTEKIYSQIDNLLKEKHHISHLTIQFEYHWCDDKGMIHR